MKSLLSLLLCLIVASAAEPAKPSPDAHPGRLLEAAGVRAEFVVQSDRRASIVFQDSSGKPIARGDRMVVVKVDGKDVALEPQPNGFLSKEPLAAKEPAPVVVQVRVSADAKPSNFRLSLNTALCGECKRAEYACTCAH